MKMQTAKLLPGLLIIVLLGVNIAYGIEKHQAEKQKNFKKISFTDGAGRKIELNRPINRVISGTSDIGEIISILSAGETVVGVDMFLAKSALLFPELASKPVIGEHDNINLEKVIELAPDIYLANTSLTWSSKYETIVKSLEPEIKVICLDFIDLNTFTEHFKLLAEILNREAEGNEFLEFHNGVLDNIRKQTQFLGSEEKPWVYWEMYKQYRTFTRRASMYQVQIDLAGGRNIAEHVQGVWIEVDREWLAGTKPDIVVKVAYPNAGYPGVPKTSCGYEVNNPAGMMKLIEIIKQRDFLQSATTGILNRVYAQHYHLMDSPRNFIGVAYMAKWFHPDLFKDLDPAALHREYLSKFLGIKADFAKTGVFVYPE